jgi:biotin carboxylase
MDQTNSSNGKPGILCIASYEKGQAFLREAARLGASVALLTQDKLEGGDWPRESLSAMATMVPNLPPAEVVTLICRLLWERRIERFDRVVALDEFDLETAALVREHMRLPGMGQTTTRHFRDKLAMRSRAQRCGVPVPEFSGVFNGDELREFMESVPGPWLLKPRGNAAAIGIRRIDRPETLWPALAELGDQRSEYVLERFVAGEVYHVEGITWNREVLFAAPHRYGQPPIQTVQQGGVFTTRSLHPESEDARQLVAIHAEVLQALGMVSGVTHTEFIKSAEDGRFYFLETAARVGGAHIAEVVEFAQGVNPWVEWARIEVAGLMGRQYALPEIKPGYAGSVICLARQEWPDTSAYRDLEIVYRLQRYHHAGLIVRSDLAERIEDLLDTYGRRFLEDFCAVEPPPLSPTA